MLYRGPWTQYAEIWVAAAGLLRLLVGCLYPPTPPPTHLRSPSPTNSNVSAVRQPKATVSALCRPSGDYRYRPARHHVTMLWRDSTKLECRADPRSEWLNRLKRRLSSGSVVTRGFESRSDILGLQTVLVELRYPTTFYREGGGRVAGLGRVFSYTSQKLSIGGTYFSQCKTWRIRVRWISRWKFESVVSARRVWDSNTRYMNVCQIADFCRPLVLGQLRANQRVLRVASKTSG